MNRIQPAEPAFFKQICWVFILICLIQFPSLHAQEIPVSPAIEDTIPKKELGAAAKALDSETDLVIEWHKWFGKKISKAKDTGRVQHSILPAAGYSQQTGFAGIIAASYVFYPKKIDQETQKPSNLLTSITYSQYNQVIFPIQADIWFRKNAYYAVIDWRFLAYPSTTFGLGGKTKLSDGYTINFNYIKLHQSLLKKISKTLYSGIGIFYDHFWNITEELVSPNIVTSFDKYGFTKKSTSAGFALRLLSDTRNNAINASKGAYINIIGRPNFTLLGSDANWNSMLVEVRKYFHFPASSKNVLALWSYNWFTLGKGKPPYFLLPSTGWDDFYNTGRGYIQGRYRGKDMIYLESEYRFDITRNGLVGLVVFANAQSFSSKITKQLRLITPGFGTGLRIKLNKITGANLCIDYGFGLDGSRGISVNLGEVF